MSNATDVFDRLYHTVGELIRQRREDLGLTQAQLAERLGVTQPAVSAWQRGKDFPKDLLAVADALEVPHDKILAVVEAAARANDKVEQAIREQMLLGPDVRDALVMIYRQLLSAATRSLGSGGTG